MAIDFNEIESMPIEVRIGRRIRAIRTLRGINQTQIAQATGMSTQTLSRLETGKTDFHLSTIKAIEQVLKCTLLLIPNEDLV